MKVSSEFGYLIIWSLGNNMHVEKRILLLNNLNKAHKAFYESEMFSGPSLYFHIKSLDASIRKERKEFIEYTYAMLASWGMHRMGKGGSKMRDFEEYNESINIIWDSVIKLQGKYPENLSESDWHTLKDIFIGIKVMASKTSLVGNSKVMAHALPKLVPPVDREHTLNFLFGKTDIKNDIEKEWKLLQDILIHFFYPILENEEYINFAEKWITENKSQYKWDTSLLKIIDNIIIGYHRNIKK